MVMGGRCQVAWEHAVPKIARCGPRISVTLRWATALGAGPPPQRVSTASRRVSTIAPPRAGGTEHAERAHQTRRDDEETERAEAASSAGGRPATDDEAQRADEHELEPGVAAHEDEMNEKGANQQGEGRVP